tara:strand:+ start:8437 stop:8928 length:492 start_codon:yes stop_codon:yes gene_type:complete
MELIKHFEIYIAAQRATGMQVAFFGAALLIAAILLHFSQLNPITQGLRNSFLVISILLMASGIGFLANQKKLMKTNTEVYQSNKQVFKAQEITRMQKVNKSVPAIILGLSIALIILILAQVFFIHPPFWKGLTFGVLIYFLGLLITESISYLSVKSYLEALLN